MASIDPVITDPDDIFINIKLFASYDTGCGSNPSEIETDINAGILDWAKQTQINNFNSTFRSTDFEKAVTLSNKCVTDVGLIRTKILQYQSVCPLCAWGNFAEVAPNFVDDSFFLAFFIFF